MRRKHPGGRPTSYRSEYCPRIVALMAEGRSLDGCAPLLGVNPDSLYEWQKVHAEFSLAVRAGRAAATTFWENRLLAVAHGEPGNAQAIQWALRNRSRAASGWHHDTQRVEHFLLARFNRPTRQIGAGPRGAAGSSRKLPRRR